MVGKGEGSDIRKKLDSHLAYIAFFKSFGNLLIKVRPNSKLYNFRWKHVDWLIEVISKSKVGERGWEVVDWSIEVETKGKDSERGWKIIDCLVELESKFEVFDSGRERVH